MTMARVRSELLAAWSALRTWPARRYLVAATTAALTVVVVAVPTAMIPNPVFGREIATTAWAWPVLVVTSVLSGLLFATYVRAGRPTPLGAPDGGLDAGEVAQSRTGMIGTFLTFLAVGCPVCNKLALVALGYAGAIQWFAPIQPWLGAAGILLLGYALTRRLATDGACVLPAPRDRVPTGEPAP
ncbi:MAG TPA: hypothetical protein VN257_03125 [Actinotalea sp.]|nr:hypothetical protein [Actinotalea sp.]